MNYEKEGGLMETLKKIQRINELVYKINQSGIMYIQCLQWGDCIDIWDFPVKKHTLVAHFEDYKESRFKDGFYMHYVTMDRAIEMLEGVLNVF